MAGGIGSRFWPLSKDNCPKQFLDILGTGKSFIRSTFERFHPIIPAEHFLVVTNAAYKEMVLEHLPELKPEQVLCEPARRNTAPCIAYAMYNIKSKCADANIVVTPADHLVTNEREFQRIISLGFDFLNQNEHHDDLLTIGIKPSRPETGYGYIQVPKTDTYPKW
jgi:Mannose-1-phosphate guanylyltransferase